MATSSAPIIETPTVVRIRRRLEARMVHNLSLLSRPTRTLRMLRDDDLVIGFPLYRGYALQIAKQTVAGLVVVIGLLALGIISSTTWLTALAMAILVLVAGVVAWTRWHSGSTSLQRRGLPPGELTTLACPMIDRDHHQTSVDKHGSTFTTNHLRKPVVSIYGLKRGNDVFRDSQADLSPMPRPDNHMVEGGFVRALEGDDHRRVRSSLSPLFTSSVLERLRPVVEASVDASLASWDESGTPARPRPLVDDLVLNMLLTLFYGASAHYEPKRLARLSILYRQIDHLYMTPEMRDIQDQLVAEVRVLGRLPDLPDCLLRELIARSPGRLDDLGLVENVVHLITTSHADMWGLFDWIMKFLVDNPAWFDRLRGSSPEQARIDADAFVCETLRLAQSELLLRVTKRPIEVDGYRIPARWIVRVLVRESHRDPAVFEDPLEFRPDRFVSRSYGRLEYSPFGLDGRSCIAESLARMASAVFVTRLAERFDIETVEDGPLQLSIHRHAAPNSNWKVSLSPAAAAVERAGLA